MRSVTDGKTLHSMHSYFLRPADIGAAVRYEVELLRDGRGYSTRQVRGYQNGKPVYVCLASFAAGEAAARDLRRTPLGRAGHPRPGGPAQLGRLPRRQAGARRRDTMTERSRAYWSGGRSFDMRHVPGPVYLTVEGERVPHQAVWIRPFDALRPVDGLTDEQRDLAALAYVCDYTILEPVLRVLGLPWAEAGPGHRQPRPRHVVPPSRPACRRLAALRAGSGRRRRRPRRRHRHASSPATAVTWPPSSRRA